MRNLRDTARDGHGLERVTLHERTHPDVYHGIWNNDLLEFLAVRKFLLQDLGDSVRDDAPAVNDFKSCQELFC